MHLLAQVARVIGLVVCSLAVLFYSGAVIAAIIAFATSGPADTLSTMDGRILGALFVDLLFFTVALRFWKGIMRNR